MKNYELIQQVVDYIEAKASFGIPTDEIIAGIPNDIASDISVYHLNRMFSSCLDFSIREYIERRRLTEAARRLVRTDDAISSVAAFTGYEDIQEFTMNFSRMYGCAPEKYRERGIFAPKQLKARASASKTLEGDRIRDIRAEHNRSFKLVGFTASTTEGFQVIPMCWAQINARKQEIPHTASDFLIALNDYSSGSDIPEESPFFDYYCCAEVSDFSAVPSGMVKKDLAPADYIVFSYRGKAEDSMGPIVTYIYKEWFPESDCLLDETKRYDLVRYGQQTDASGASTIEFWVPVR